MVYITEVRVVPRAKLFMNGRSQAVRLPKEFRFDGTEVDVRRDGESVVLTPIHGDPWTRFVEFQRAHGPSEITIPKDRPTGIPNPFERWK